jgi:hypothetical protein
MAMQRGRSIWIWCLVGLFVAFVAIQFVPVDRTNPPVTGEISAPAYVMSVLARACYNCHSHETKWPWYSRVAPVSWQIAHDVHEAREALNFSTWSRLGTAERPFVKREIWKEVSTGEMPPWFYLPLHPEARLSAEDHSLLRAWSQPDGSD